MDEAFDKLEEDTGLKLNESMKNAIEAAKLQDLWVDQMKNSVAALKQVAFDPASFDSVADQIMTRMNEAVAKNPGLQGIATQIQNVIDQLRVNPGNAQLWSQLNTLMGQATTQIQGTGTALSNTNQSLQSQTTYLANANKQYQAYIENLRQVALAQAQQITGGKTGMPTSAEEAQALAKAKGGGPVPPGGAEGASAGLDQQLQKIAAVKAAMTDLATTAGTVFTQIGQAAAVTSTIMATAFQTAATITATSFQTMATEVGKVDTQIGQAAAVTSVIAATAFQTAGKIIATSFDASALAAGKVFTQIGQAAAVDAVIIATSFQKSNAIAAQSFQSTALAAGKVFTQIGQASAVDAVIIATSFTKSAQLSVAAFQTMTRGSTIFQQLATAGTSSGRAIGTAFQSAGTTVGNAMNSAAGRARSAMSSIQSSANSANSSVRSLASSINSLRSKTITITTIYRQVIQRVYAAKGFGPSVVNSATNFTAGESGPELVSVIPLSQSASSGASNITTSSITNTRVTNSLHNSGVNNVLGGGSGGITNTSSLTQQSSVLNRFSDSVSKITNAFNRQESMMNSVTNNTMIQNASTVGNSRNISSTGGFGITNTVTNNNGIGGIPNISTIRGGGGGGSARGGGDLESLVGAIKDMVLAAFGQTTINLNNTTTIDTEKVYEAQKKQFGLRNGSMFK